MQIISMLTRIVPWLLAALLFPLAHSAPAQETPAHLADKKATYRSKNSSGEEFTLTLPFIESDNEQAARRINTFFHDQFLNTLPDASAGTDKNLRLILLFLGLRGILACRETAADQSRDQQQ